LYYALVTDVMQEVYAKSMIHTPKRISSSGGLGLNTKKELEFLSDTLAIGRETWGKLDAPWQESGTIIAEEGYVWLTRWEANKPYIITKFYNANGQEVGTYCDIAKPLRRTADGFEFDDLYLDVWRIPGEKPVLLDEDELAEALAAKYVTQQEADAAYVAVNELLAILDSDIVQLHSLNS
jgi:predicted RNA-binding protein associated with RNAse of E/G family